jgi:hypothetical protein
VANLNAAPRPDRPGSEAFGSGPAPSSPGPHQNYLGQLTLEQARAAIAGLEALFGVYVGYMREELFQYRRETHVDGTAGPANKA